MLQAVNYWILDPTQIITQTWLWQHVILNQNINCYLRMLLVICKVESLLFSGSSGCPMNQQKIYLLFYGRDK